MWIRFHSRMAATLITLLLAGVGSGSAAELSSKRFRFTENKLLTIHLTAGESEIRSILFEFPSGIIGIKGPNRAKVKVVNRGSSPAKIGLAIALFDSQERLVGVSSGGTKGIRLKPGAEVDYNLPFHFLDGLLGSASSFYISIDTD